MFFLKLTRTLALGVAIVLSISPASNAQEQGDSGPSADTSEPKRQEQSAEESSKPQATAKPASESVVDPVELRRRKLARARGEITFDDLKFDIEKGGKFERKMLTKEIEELNKRTVRVRGYMFPTFQQRGIKEFVLVRDNMECCFGPGAAIYDCVRVLMDEGKSANFSTRPITVRGKLEIEEFRAPDGLLLAIYKITATEVK